MLYHVTVTLTSISLLRVHFFSSNLVPNVVSYKAIYSKVFIITKFWHMAASSATANVQFLLWNNEHLNLQITWQVISA
jgi:hypothetical protein